MVKMKVRRLGIRNMLDIRVGRILRAWIHKEADSLYGEEVDVSEPEPRIICSGLVKFIPLDQLQRQGERISCEALIYHPLILNERPCFKEQNDCPFGKPEFTHNNKLIL